MQDIIIRLTPIFVSPTPTWGGERKFATACASTWQACVRQTVTLVCAVVDAVLNAN